MWPFDWLREKPKPQEPPVLYEQTKREWVWMVTISERSPQGLLLRTATFPCESAEVAADLQSRFSASQGTNFCNSVVRQAILKSENEVKWPSW